MSKEEDAEIKKINEKKLKAKGAKIVEEKQALNFENIVLNLCDFLEARGLEQMNVARDLKNLIANQKQQALNKQNVNDSEKQ